MSRKEHIGLIVGSGMADFGRESERVANDTRCGTPSAAVRVMQVAGQTVHVIPRHGDEHTIPPHRINYRANLLALQGAGCSAIVCLNTVGVIPAHCRPGELAVPDQVIDYTWGREHTFFDGGTRNVQHVDVSEPFTQPLRSRLIDAASRAGVTCHDGGVYGATQGPRLETRAEVDRLESDGVSYLGMTGMPEFALARELGLDVACLAMIVNPAAGRGSGGIHADIEASMQTAKTNAVSTLQCFLQV